MKANPDSDGEKSASAYTASDDDEDDLDPEAAATRYVRFASSRKSSRADLASEKKGACANWSALSSALVAKYDEDQRSASAIPQIRVVSATGEVSVPKMFGKAVEMFGKQEKLPVEDGEDEEDEDESDEADALSGEDEEDEDDEDARTECEFDGQTMLLSRDVRDLLEVKAELDVARERLHAQDVENEKSQGTDTNATSGVETGRKTFSSPEKASGNGSGESGARSGGVIGCCGKENDTSRGDGLKTGSEAKPKRHSLAGRLPPGLPSAMDQERDNNISPLRNTVISLDSRSTLLPHAHMLQQQSAVSGATQRLSKTSMYTIPNLPPTVLETETMIMSDDQVEKLRRGLRVTSDCPTLPIDRCT